MRGISSWNLFHLLALAALVPFSNAVAVMSVDMGSEWMKVAYVSPGVPMEIALNKESLRKTPVVVALRDGERFFGELAVSLGIRFPEKAYAYMLDLLGKRMDNPSVELFMKRFPFYNITADSTRQTVVYHHPEGPSFTPEELLSMVLKYAQEISTLAAGQAIKDCVITVPVFFNQPERRAMLSSANLAGLKVLQLINTNTAVALHYGIFRRKDFNDTPINILFYDMGASSTTATVATYQTIKTKERGFVETNPQVTIKGVGFDRTLGGLEMQLRLRDDLGRAFNAQKKTKNDVFKNNRALAKLLAEAGRLKKVLSANNEHIAQSENLIDDQDLKVPYTREEFENLIKDLLLRVGQPVDTAVKMSGLAMEDISQVILFGAGTRVPSVQKALLEATGKEELGKSINTDEAAAMGGVYQAAYLSKGFKVKTFIVKDANLFPIQVDFQREYETENGDKAVKVVRRTLFGRGNMIPQKKVITFTRHTTDFEFYVNYGDLDFLTPEETKYFGSLNLTRIKLKGVGEALGKHFDDGSEIKGVKAKFNMDENGILSIEQVESVFEKKTEEIKEEVKEDDLESTLAKLGSTIGKLFSSAAGNLDPEETTAPNEEKKEETPEEVPSEKTKEETTKEKETNQTEQTEKKEEETIANKSEKIVPEKTVKLVTIKEPIEVEVDVLDMLDPSLEDVQVSKDKLKTLDEEDRSRLERDMSRNILESFISETKDKLYSNEFEAVSTQEQREEIMKALQEAGEWLEYESDQAKTEAFKEKFAELKTLTKELFDRVREDRERPEAVRALREMLNLSSVFLNGSKNASTEDQIFTDIEIKTLDNLIQETNKWLKDTESIQKETKRHETPKMTVKSIAEKITNLDREVKYLLNKARFAVPKKKTPPPPKMTLNETVETETKDSKEPLEDIEEATVSEEKETTPEKETKKPIDVEEVNVTEEKENLQLEDTKSQESSTSKPEPTESKQEQPHTEL